MSRKSKVIVVAIKNNSTASTREGVQRIIPYSARQLAQHLALEKCLQDCFVGETVAVPMPRSAPLVPGGLWPAYELAQALQTAGVVNSVAALLERRTAVTKSATASAADRPSPEGHFESLAVSPARPLLSPTSRLVIVDDVVTRGATFLAAFARLSEAFPSTAVSCFALVRTISEGETEQMIDPVSGTISTRAGYLHREP